MIQATTLAMPYSLEFSVHQRKEEEAKETRRDVVEENGIGCEGKCPGVSFWVLLSALQFVSHPEYTKGYNQSAS